MRDDADPYVLPGDDGVLEMRCVCGAAWWAREDPRGEGSPGELRPSECPLCGRDGVPVDA